MSQSSGFPQKLADLLAQNRLMAQMVGVALAVGGFAGLWWLAPANRAAQLSAAVVGFVLVLFAQFFFMLRRLKPEERGSLEAAGAGGLVLCLAASLGASGYHWTTGPRGGASQGERAAGGPAAAEVEFDANEPNRLVIKTQVARADRVVVEVQDRWELTPDAPPAATLDWPPSVDVELPTNKQPPYRVTALSGNELPIVVLLQPLYPDSSADPINEENRWVTRIKFAQPPAKEYVFLLRLSVVTKQRKTLPVGSVVYFPDLKTKYEKLTPANEEALREIAAIQGPKSPKLVELLQRAGTK